MPSDVLDEDSAPLLEILLQPQIVWQNYVEPGAESRETIVELGEKASQFVVDWAHLRSLRPGVNQGSDNFLNDGKVGKDEEGICLRNNGC